MAKKSVGLGRGFGPVLAPSLGAVGAALVGRTTVFSSVAMWLARNLVQSSSGQALVWKAA